MLKQPALFHQGFHLTRFSLNEEIKIQVQKQNWTDLDQSFQKLTAKEGRLHAFLKLFHDFDSIEFIISIRNAANPWEEDGIWHDDGSRVLSFSLSLTETEIEGGTLGIRPQGQETFVEVPTPDFGGIILFLTGAFGYEHRIHQVIKGQRIIIAGWCT